jgi:two-component system, OmpR family, alkaline phosphatase synthesis response regulator PhoP
MHVLIVEDDPNLAELIAMHLRGLPAAVTICHQGWAGLDAASTGTFDFVVLDVMLPGISGLEICRRLRHNQLQVPILMLTAKSEEQDKIAGLEIGADDYLTKPFAPGELVARVRSILRRTRHASKQARSDLQRLECGELALDLAQKSLRKGQHLIELTAKEFELLNLFMQNPGRSFSRQEILDEVWGEHFDGLEHTVNSNINRLRAKIEADPSAPRYLLTAWGIGYKFAIH